jgi:hypothetical protein
MERSCVQANQDQAVSDNDFLKTHTCWREPERVEVNVVSPLKIDDEGSGVNCLHAGTAEREECMQAFQVWTLAHACLAIHKQC